jgi:16S rRNA G966 N2-methylase RsmD
MDKKEYRKLGKNYNFNDNTLLYGITPRLGQHLAERFKEMCVLETCTGAGFLTIELAKVAKKVITVDISQEALDQAQYNATVENVESKITFLQGNILNQNILDKIPAVDGAILDPVWNHQDLNLTQMSPPAYLLYETIKRRTENIALILPPNTDEKSLERFPEYEQEILYLDGMPALMCLYFGHLKRCKKSEFHARENIP